MPENIKQFRRVMQEQLRQRHREIACLLSGAGFDVRSVERLDTHPVWQIKLRRGAVPKGAECKTATQTLGVFLKTQGVTYPERDNFPVVQGDRIAIGFVGDFGVPCKLTFCRGLATEFWPSMVTEERD